MVCGLSRIAGAVLCGGLAIYGATPAVAETPMDFFAGKTMTYIVGGGAGGSYDFYGRLVARYMEPTFPGVTMVVKNVQAAGGIAGANAIYAAKPDGLTIGTSNTGLIYGQIAGSKGIKFDLTKVSWIGKAATDSRVVVTSALSPYKTFADMQKATMPIKFSIGGFGSSASAETMILSKVFDLKIHVIPGYTGSEPEMSMRRGEIDANVGFLSSWDTFLKSGFGQVALQIGGDPLPGVPQANKLATTKDQKSLVALVASQADLSRFTFGPPDIPADRLAVLRASYKTALENPDLRKEVERTGRPVDPLYGDDVGKVVREALDQSPEMVAFIKEAMSKKEK
jgi:tripartite-type tricarboxylate transporter receptor subunit TctC